MPASQQELDELDLKLRSLRTQLRKAEENSNQLAKQKRELEEKTKKNTNDINRLRTEVKKTEDENNLLIKEGKKSAPQRTVKGNFVNVVRKAQAAAWEEKFMAMKAKQKESNKMSEELMSKMNRVKRTDSPLLSGLKKDKKKEEGREGGRPSLGKEPAEEGRQGRRQEEGRREEARLVRPGGS
ncbi:hypothetical protein OS493_028626 [Desmophyllum pertusum]|uniref:Uncharacterized protein n=1 Tax=Desmophyllum pertusum TaxID=174260 RepID=A0A9X0CP81_9CNID|nr:hypothetical protein OS493_028626 [Desmophyllum pertusum]